MIPTEPTQTMTHTKAMNEYGIGMNSQMRTISTKKANIPTTAKGSVLIHNLH